MPKSMVVIPTYNERENLTRLIPEILSLDEKFHILVVDDNSPDGTGAVADKFAAENPGIVHVLHRESKEGLGKAYIAGFKYALEFGADYIFEMDADLSHDPERLPAFLPKMEECDIVVGSRYLKGISIVNWALKRLILSLAANKYARFITGLKVSDTTSGYKCFKRKVLEDIDLDKVHSDGYAFQIEMNYRAKKLGYKIGEIPIIFIDRDLGNSKMSKKIIWEAIWMVWRLRLGFYSK
jgi:dolichol-phosphate mannosyltransferase